MSNLTDRIAADVSGIFLGTSAFAVDAVFSWNGDVKTIAGNFEENYRAVDQFGNEVLAHGPVFLAARADVEDDDGDLPDSSATLEVDEVTYHITKANDSDDTVTLILSRDEAAIDA